MNILQTFTDFNDFFDKIYVITIPRNRNRQQLITKDLAGLNYQWFSGIDGFLLSDKTIAEVNDPLANLKYMGRIQSNGEIGCSLSHQKIYEEIIKNDYQQTLVLEDDVSPILDNFAFYWEALTELPDDWEFFYLNYAAYRPFNFFYKLKELLIYWGKLKPYTAYYSLAEIYNRYSYPNGSLTDLAGRLYGTRAYVINKQGAEKILAYQTPQKAIIDEAIGNLCQERRLKAYLIKPMLFEHRNELASTIWNE